MLEEQSYPLFTETEVEPYTFSHDPFTINLANSEDNTLCGALTYEAYLDETQA